MFLDFGVLELVFELFRVTFCVTACIAAKELYLFLGCFVWTNILSAKVFLSFEVLLDCDMI